MVGANGRNDQWDFVGPGGGGALPFIPAVNPRDPDNVFVSSDMTGSFVTYDAGEKWRMFNLRGVTRFYGFDRKDEKVIYAGTSNMLFKSVDKGISWNTIYPGPDEISAIIAQGDHAEELVVTADSTRTVIEHLAVDPTETKRLYLLTRKMELTKGRRSTRQHKRFYMEIMYSADGGSTWSVFDKMRFDLHQIFIDPTSPLDNRTLYVSGEDGLGAKVNGTWRRIALPPEMPPIEQFVDGVDTVQNKHIIYAMSGSFPLRDKSKHQPSGIFMSDDKGHTWKRVDQELFDKKMEGAEEPVFESIATSYYHPGHVSVSYSQFQFHKDSIAFGVARSANYGKTWDMAWKDTFVANGKDGSARAATNRESAWIDHSFGPAWGENPFYLGVSDHNPKIVYATDWGRVIKTTDGGTSWVPTYTKEVSKDSWKSRGMQVTTANDLKIDPFDSLNLLLANADIGLFKSADGGNSWSHIGTPNGIPRDWAGNVYRINFDELVQGKIWLAVSNIHDLPRPKMWRSQKMEDYRGGVVVSTDGGQSWSVSSEDVGQAAVTDLQLDTRSELDQRHLYLCAFGKGVFKSVDGGLSWERRNKGIEGMQPAAYRITQREDGELFLVVARKSDDGSIGTALDGALYRSSDNAESWVKQQMPYGVNGPTSVLVDPRDPRRIFLSAWGRPGKTDFSADEGGGIFLSEDDGEHWTPVLIDDQHIYQITADPRNGFFYAVGFNSSAYRSEDSGLTWNRIKGYNFKWGQAVIPDPINAEKVYILTFGGGVWHGPSKGDANALEDIGTPGIAY